MSSKPSWQPRHGRQLLATYTLCVIASGKNNARPKTKNRKRKNAINIAGKLLEVF